MSRRDVRRRIQITNRRSAVHFARVVAALGVASGAGIPFAEAQTTGSPIKHVIVIFQENVSFDHYFATYPKAFTLPSEPIFPSRG